MFSELPTSALYKIVKVMSSAEFERGQDLVTEGDKGETMMVILQGSAVVLIDSVEVRKFGPLDVLGEAALLVPPDGEIHTRGATVRTESAELSALVLHRSDYNKLKKTGAIDDVTQLKAQRAASAFLEADKQRFASVVSALGKVKMFSALQEESLGKMVGVMEFRNFEPNQALVSQGDLGSELFVIMSGSAKVLVDGIEVRRFGMLDVLGEAALLAVDGEPHRRGASVISVTILQALVLTRASYDKLKSQDKAIQEWTDKQAAAAAKAYVDADTQRIVGILLKTPIFSELSPEMVRKVVNVMTPRAVAPGVDLVTQGHEGYELMCIMQGTAIVLVDDVVVRRFGILDILGEGSITPGKHVRGATVRAESHTHVMVLSREQYDTLKAEDSSFREMSATADVKAAQLASAYLEEDVQRVVLALQQTELFAGAPAKALRRVVGDMEMRYFDKGKDLVKQGDPGAELMVITRGAAVVTVDGNKVADFGMLDVLGEISLTPGDHLRGATVTASEPDTRALCLSRNAYQRLKREDQDFANINTDAKVAAIAAMYKEKDARRAEKALSETDMFRDMALEVLRKIVEIMKNRRFETGQHLTTQGEKGDSLIVLLKGSATILVDGNEIATCEAPCVLGEGSLAEGDHMRG